MNEIWLTWFNYTREHIKRVHGEDAWEEIMTMCGDPLADIHFAELRSKLRGEEE